ncbi:RDD family protein [Pseudomonas sp. BMS12]|uniref:RDD family protein n=1 Tax=Pseudomonas sp. BMS12 TaxID=1796033 RepID=UPI00083AAACA|nr:RDD family protein [Pseudomonas sp. BMS12]
MPKHMLRPQGEFPGAGLIRRCAAMFYDFLLCVALMMVITLLYKVVQMGIYGQEQLRQMSDAGALDGDPLLSTLLVMSLFGFFAKFWTHNGQTLGMQVWGLRIQNADGSAVSLWQALLRFVVSIGSWLCLGLGFFWVLWDKNKRSWHDIYSDSRVVQLPKGVHKQGQV